MAVNHIDCIGAAQTAAARRWLALRGLLLFYSGKRAWAHLRRPRKGFCCCFCYCWMLIGGAFRDCIHPHADAIYRSAADVRVSPSFDDEINKLCRTTTRRAVASDGPGRFRPGPDSATTVRVMPRHSASWRLLRWLRIVRRWIGWDQDENPTWPDAGRLICNRVGSGRLGRRHKLTSSVGDISRQTRAAHVTIRRRRTDCLTVVFAGYKWIDLSVVCLSMINLQPSFHTRWHHVHAIVTDEH